MFAGEISNLAGLRLGVVTRRDLAADERIKMTQSGSAVTVGWNWPARILESAMSVRSKKQSSKTNLASRRSPCSQIVSRDSIPKVGMEA